MGLERRKFVGWVWKSISLSSCSAAALKRVGHTYHSNRIAVTHKTNFIVATAGRYATAHLQLALRDIGSEFRDQAMGKFVRWVWEIISLLSCSVMATETGTKC